MAPGAKTEPIAVCLHDDVVIAGIVSRAGAGILRTHRMQQSQSALGLGLFDRRSIARSAHWLRREEILKSAVPVNAA